MKRKSIKEKREDFLRFLINDMLAPHGVTYDDVLGVKDFFDKYTWTYQESLDFIKKHKKEFIKQTGTPAGRYNREMGWFMLQWGLRYSTDPNGVPIEKKMATKPE